MLHDDHIHTRIHVDSGNEAPPHKLAPVLESAAEKNIIPGVREHPYLPESYRIGPFEDFDYAMRMHEVDRFVSLFADAGVPMGLEVDYLAGLEEEQAAIIEDMTARAAAKGVPVQGIIGSVHLLPGTVKDVAYPKGDVKHISWDLDESVFIAHFKDRGPENLLRDYFGAIRELVKMNIYDLLGHIDLIRKFDKLDSSGKSIYYGDHEDLYVKLSREVVEAISESGMGMEINTSGFFKQLGRQYITQEILNYAVELKIPITIGSDSHMPDGIGAKFDVALRMLETAGASNPHTLKDRKFEQYTPSP